MTDDRMAEAEVSLRLATYLLGRSGSDGNAEVSLDGAHIEVGSREIFPIAGFLGKSGWKQIEQAGKNPWQGVYMKDGKRLRIHTKPGLGDVVARVGGRQIRAECKGGKLVKRKGNPEYSILKNCLGQLLTIKEVNAQDTLVVAVPDTVRFRLLSDDWRKRPLVVRSGIQIALVGQDGNVTGIVI